MLAGRMGAASYHMPAGWTLTGGGNGEDNRPHVAFVLPTEERPMPVCPSCHSEYRKGFDTCATCKVPLVDKLQDVAVHMGEADEKAYFEGKTIIMVTQGAVGVCMEMRDVLDQGGCPARIKPLEGMEDAPPMHQIFSVEIVDTDLDKARNILGGRWRDAVTAEGSGATGEMKEAVLAEGAETECPACGTKFTPTDPAKAECPECGLYLGIPA